MKAQKKEQELKLKGQEDKIRECETGEEALIAAIIIHFKGVSNVLKILKKEAGIEISRQVLTNWRVRGRVPISLAFRVASALDISPYTLNFTECCVLHGHVEKWKDVVLNTPIPQEHKKIVLSLPPPRQMLLLSTTK